MVEIALATAIIAIGISSILVLFPIGINATRAAMDENYYLDAAEVAACFVRSRYLKEWRSKADTAAIGEMPDFKTDFLELFPTTKPDDPKTVDGTNIESGLQKLANGVYKFSRVGYDGEEIFSATVKIWSNSADLKVKAATTNALLYIPNTTDYSMALVDETISLTKPDGAADSSGWSFEAFAQSAMVEISWGDNVRSFRVDVYNPYYIIPPTTP